MSNYRKWWIWIGLVSVIGLVIGLVIWNREGTKETGGGSNSQSNQSDLRVAIAVDTTGTEDNSFNQIAKETCKRLIKVGKVKICISPTPESDAKYKDNVDFLAKKASLVIAMGARIEGPALLSATEPRHKKARYIVIDSESGKTPPSNVALCTFRDYEGAFMAGVVAATTAQDLAKASPKKKQGKVGFIGGVSQLQTIQRFATGFLAGVASIDPTMEVGVRYAESFSDAAKVGQLSEELYSSGHEVIYHAVGGSSSAIFNTAKKCPSNQNCYVIGTDKDQSELAPTKTLTSVVKDVGAVIEASVNGKGITFGKLNEFGLKDGFIKLAKQNLPPGVDKQQMKAVIHKFEQAILAGDIKVPTTTKELQQFKANLLASSSDNKSLKSNKVG